MSLAERIRNPGLRSRVMTADEAAALVPAGANVGMSGFTGSGRSKAVPQAPARRIEALNAAGGKFKIGLWTGASTAPELDGALARVEGIEMRLPYPSDPTCRRLINAGKIAYTDIHLSNVAQHAWFGFLGHLDAISRQSFSSKTGPASRDKLAAENGAWWSLTWRMSSPPGERS